MDKFVNIKISKNFSALQSELSDRLPHAKKSA